MTKINAYCAPQSTQTEVKGWSKQNKKALCWLKCNETVLMQSNRDSIILIYNDETEI
jgi:hypothetical protein